MGAEHLWLKRRAEATGEAAPSDYEWHDTLASLAMGTGSFIIPQISRKYLQKVRPGRSRGAAGMALLATAAAAGAATVIADKVANRAARRAAAKDGQTPLSSATETNSASAGAAAAPETADLVRRATGPAALVAAGLAITTTWGYYSSANWLYENRLGKDTWLGRDRGNGLAAWAAAIIGWDFVYYWNHRFMHEWRYMWAIHVIHHSSERYNLSTALRQTWGDTFGTFVPYFMAAFGVHPNLIEQARGINLLYQYWIHTDAIKSLGPLEKVLNTASHHRVHHGANPQYLDKNYGSILILWDRWFKTFEPEDEPVRYGLTKNINTYNPLRIATHEHADIIADVSRSTNWRDRLSFVFRGPGWAYRRRDELAAAV